MPSAPGAKPWQVITRRFLITRCRCSTLNWRPPRRCKNSGVSERMLVMFFRRNIVALLLVALLTLLLCGCKKTANAPLSTATAQTGATTSESSQNPAIELEVVAPQAIDGGIVAPGKFLVSENRMAVIGPVHEGRLIRLYAGQGNTVKKGQKLADLQSPDIDDAEADYLKALADYNNAQRTAQAELKLAQSTYDRTKMLYEKTITPGKNLLSAEHDLEVAKATSENTIASTKAVLTAARHRLLILGLKESEVDALATKSDLTTVFSLTSPIEGIVVERNATVGATVSADTNLFKIIDISSLWIDANVFEKDI